MRVAVSGATGFIGTPLVRRLVEEGHSVVALSRHPPPPGGSMALSWRVVDWESSTVDAVSGCDAVIHLAGEPIAQRWSQAAKKKILESREGVTRSLAECVVQSKSVRIFIGASAVGFYGPRGDEELTEESSPGNDFQADVCRAWEAACEPARQAGLRVVSTRIGVVLHPQGGVLARMLYPFRMGLGGTLGTGQQWVSWIHREDLISLFLLALHSDGLSGPVNATAPHPVRNREFTAALGRAIGRPTLVAVPAWAMKLALGEMSTLVLTGQRVLPAQAKKHGFVFRFPELDAALDDLLRQEKGGR